MTRKSYNIVETPEAYLVAIGRERAVASYPHTPDGLWRAEKLTRTLNWRLLEAYSGR